MVTSSAPGQAFAMAAPSSHGTVASSRSCRIKSGVSSAAAKREGDYDNTFKELMLKLEKPESEFECRKAWTDNTEWLSTAAPRWYGLLLEAYCMSMKDFGVEIDLDEHDQKFLQEAA